MSVREKLLVLFIQTCKLNVIIDNFFYDLIKNDRKISAKTGNKKKIKRAKKIPSNSALK